MLKFLVFADLHYKKGMYAVGLEQLQAVLERAAREQVDFVVHVGDLCNDYKGSPELFELCRNHACGLPIYGVYGNHELETEGNTMDVITPRLCNREVVFGGTDVGYWYADVKEYRLIGLDTNYSYNEELQKWEHNRPASWCAPKGNRNSSSLSPRQLEWLDRVLAEAAAQGKKAVVFSHVALSGVWRSSPDAPAVRDLFHKYSGTVQMAINGHLHTDHFAVVDNVAYLDANTVYNGHWVESDEYHYGEEHTVNFTDYDSHGVKIGVKEIPLNSLQQATNTWYFKTPLSAVVTISDQGEIMVDGSKTEWLYNVVAENMPEGCKPEIEDRHVVLEKAGGSEF